jgi:hypothetical protein
MVQEYNPAPLDPTNWPTSAMCRSAGSSFRFKHPYPPQRLPGFESGSVNAVRVGEILGWRWWKIVDDRLLTLNGSEPVPSGPFEATFSSRGGVVAFKRREDAEKMFEEMSANWDPNAVTFQAQLPAGAPRVAPDGYCLGSVELWGSVYEYERGYLGQFVCVRTVDLVVGNASLTVLREKYCLGSC